MKIEGRIPAYEPTLPEPTFISGLCPKYITNTTVPAPELIKHNVPVPALEQGHFKVEARSKQYKTLSFNGKCPTQFFMFCETSRTKPVYSFGNGCGHHPKLYRSFTPPKDHKSRYVQLQDIVHGFNHSYSDRKKNKHFYWHKDKENRVIRQIRSCFAELLASGGALISYYYDVKTGVIGFFNQYGKWINISYNTMASRLNVPENRIKRLFKFLKERKYVTVTRQWYKNHENKIRAKSAKKSLMPAFFIEALGIAAWRKIERLRDKLCKRERKEEVKALKVASINTEKYNSRFPEINSIPRSNCTKSAQEWVKSICSTLKPSPS